MLLVNVYNVIFYLNTTLLSHDVAFSLQVLDFDWWWLGQGWTVAGCAVDPVLIIWASGNYPIQMLSCYFICDLVTSPDASSYEFKTLKS